MSDDLRKDAIDQGTTQPKGKQPFEPKNGRKDKTSLEPSWMERKEERKI